MHKESDESRPSSLLVHNRPKQCSQESVLPSSGRQFQFISIAHPDDAKDSTARRQVRSHAVTDALQKKRRLQQKLGTNFRVAGLKDDPNGSAAKRMQSQTLVVLSNPLLYAGMSGGMSGPFQLLASESPRLLKFLSHDMAQQPKDPVFSVSDELMLCNFRMVVRKGLNDHALLSAINFTFAFEMSAGKLDTDSLGYQNAALSSIRQRMSPPNKATSESTLGAILLLAGVEAQRGMPRQVQLHMGAIHQLLILCRENGVLLSDEIKRAIFWQDLNYSVMTGSSRVVNHTTFPELQWKRYPLSPSLFILPPGFQALSRLLDNEFVEALKDVYALQCIRETTNHAVEDVVQIAQIDNHQASVQSRLVSLPNRSSISACCHLTAYLCTALLRCRFWRTSTIPSHLSLQLLIKLQQTNDDLVWNDAPHLLVWILHIGGAFAPTGKIRSGYVALLQSNSITRLRCLYSSWPELLDILKQFIWSERAFMLQVRAFWEENSAQTS